MPERLLAQSLIVPDKSRELVRVIFSHNGIWILIYVPFIARALLLAPNMLRAPKSGQQQGGYPPGQETGWRLLAHLV